MALRRLVNSLALLLISPRAQAHLESDLLHLDAQAEATKARLGYLSQDGQRRAGSFRSPMAADPDTTKQLERALLAGAAFHVLSGWFVSWAIRLVLVLALLLVAAILFTAFAAEAGLPRRTLYGALSTLVDDGLFLGGKALGGIGAFLYDVWYVVTHPRLWLG